MRLPVCLFALVSATAAAQQAAIDRLRTDLEARDAAMAKLGVEFYTDVEQMDSRTARVLVTEDWLRRQSETLQQANVNTLYDSWRFAHGDDQGDYRLEVIGPDGKVLARRPE